MAGESWYNLKLFFSYFIELQSRKKDPIVLLYDIAFFAGGFSHYRTRNWYAGGEGSQKSGDHQRDECPNINRTGPRRPS